MPTSADGSTVSAAKGSGSIGVGIAIDVASATTKAYVQGSTALDAPTIVIGAPIAWVSGTTYTQNQVVTDPTNGSTYQDDGRHHRKQHAGSVGRQLGVEAGLRQLHGDRGLRPRRL